MYNVNRQNLRWCCQQELQRKPFKEDLVAAEAFQSKRSAFYCNATVCFHYILKNKHNSTKVIWCLLNWQRKKPSPGQEPTSKSTNLKSGNRIGYLSRIFVGSDKANVHTQPPGVQSELTAPTMTQIDSESEGIKEIERKTPSSISTPLYKAVRDTVQQTLHNTGYRDTR